MIRFQQILLITATLLGSWLGMQFVHESGHVLAVGLSGGRVTRVHLHPLSFSRTEIGTNPHPRLAVWGGPVWGALAPLLVWLVVARRTWLGRFVWRFFTGFCLVANGLYLGCGSFAGMGDAGDLLQLGVPAWYLQIFGLFTVPVGLWLWHGEGQHFGFGPSAGVVSRAATYGTLAVTLTLLLLGFLIGGE